MSSPLPLLITSSPSLPNIWLSELLPLIKSDPLPPIAFSIVVPEAIVKFPILPPILDAYKVLELGSVSLKSIN